MGTNATKEVRGRFKISDINDLIFGDDSDSDSDSDSSFNIIKPHDPKPAIVQVVDDYGLYSVRITGDLATLKQKINDILTGKNDTFSPKILPANRLKVDTNKCPHVQIITKDEINRLSPRERKYRIISLQNRKINVKDACRFYNDSLILELGAAGKTKKKVHMVLVHSRDPLKSPESRREIKLAFDRAAIEIFEQTEVHNPFDQTLKI